MFKIQQYLESGTWTVMATAKFEPDADAIVEALSMRWTDIEFRYIEV